MAGRESYKQERLRSLVACDSGHWTKPFCVVSSMLIGFGS